MDRLYLRDVINSIKELEPKILKIQDKIDVFDTKRKSFWEKLQPWFTIIISISALIISIISGFFSYKFNEQVHFDQKLQKEKEIGLQKLEIFNTIYPKLVSKDKKERKAASYVTLLLADKSDTSLNFIKNETLTKKLLANKTDSLKGSLTIYQVALMILSLNIDEEERKETIQFYKSLPESTPGKQQAIIILQEKGKTSNNFKSSNSNSISEINNNDPSNRFEKELIAKKLLIDINSIINIAIWDDKQKIEVGNLNNLSSEFQFPSNYLGLTYRLVYNDNRINKFIIFKFDSNKQIIKLSQND